VSELVAHREESEIAIHREILHRYRPSVCEDRSRSPWNEAANSGRAEVVRPGSPAWSVLACGFGGIGIRRGKAALVVECGPRCGVCTNLTGGDLVGGTGGTGSLSAHTGGHISSHGTSSLCRRFAICFMTRTT